VYAHLSNKPAVSQMLENWNQEGKRIKTRAAFSSPTGVSPLRLQNDYGWIRITTTIKN